MTDLITKIEQGCKTGAKILGVTSTIAEWRELLDLLKQRGPKPLEWAEFTAESPFGNYFFDIYKNWVRFTPKGNGWVTSEFIRRNAPTLEAAQQAAEEHNRKLWFENSQVEEQVCRCRRGKEAADHGATKCGNCGGRIQESEE